MLSVSEISSSTSSSSDSDSGRSLGESLTFLFDGLSRDAGRSFLSGGSCFILSTYDERKTVAVRMTRVLNYISFYSFILLHKMILRPRRGFKYFTYRG